MHASTSQVPCSQCPLCYCFPAFDFLSYVFILWYSSIGYGIFPTPLTKSHPPTGFNEQCYIWMTCLGMTDRVKTVLSIFPGGEDDHGAFWMQFECCINSIIKGKAWVGNWKEGLKNTCYPPLVGQEPTHLLSLKREWSESKLFARFMLRKQQQHLRDITLTDPVSQQCPS